MRQTLLLSFMLLTLNAVFAVDKIDLTSGWKFRRAGESDWLDARVPGVVHLDLLRHRLIPDPFMGTNEDSVQWIERDDWMYETSFTLNQLKASAQYQLIFEGLDTYATVFLNGTIILYADNMYRRWSVDVRPHLKDGVNTLMVLFKSPMSVNEHKLSGPLPYHMTAENDAHKDKVSVYTRKAPYHFGWDWGPRLVSCGIWRPVYLMSWEDARMEDIQIYQDSLNTEMALLHADLRLSQPDTTGTYHWQITNKQTGALYARVPVTGQLTRVPFSITSPKFWWTHNLGDPFLYHFSVQLYKDSVLAEERIIRFGLRTIEVIQEEDSIGRSFYFKLNGEPIFIKGANYIPGDVLLPRRTAADFKRLIADAKAVNMNLIRVWGGGIYEEDVFYDLCDEQGLLVWQDLMFACSMYPGEDSSFYASVREEVAYNARRLRNHASLAIWNGNNEVDMAWHHWGWQVRFMIPPGKAEKMWQAYQTLFHDLFPNILKDIDPGRTFVSTSPQSSWGKPEGFNFGTMHYWGVWHGPDDFDGYKKNVGRYMNEYGFQSFPEWPTIQSFAKESDWSLESGVMKRHQKSYIGNGVIDKFTRKYYGAPSDFQDFVYKSQLCQALGMRVAISSHRAKKGHCMGTVFWQLNDCWPGPSWSGIDYYGRWKALHYQLKELYGDLLIVPESDSTKLHIRVVSDYLMPKTGNLLVEVIRPGGKVVSRTIVALSIPANSAGLYTSLSLRNILRGLKPSQVFVKISFMEGDVELAKTLHYFVAPKQLQLDKPSMIISVNETEKTIVIEAHTLIKDLYLYAVNGDLRCSDNYFDLMPGERKTINFTGDAGDGVQFRSLNQR